ncbi:MAG: collagen-like protein [Methylotenera sp.]|uniref:hypothetical protein n=1 Tax=Methylotenera sp. TaxID=2051956 RepID=UPI0017C23E3F|nr:hypothetical protein [Methylotenera sp.]NOU25110.1 collagen-like protein [Methylotenera sp.]
MKNSILLSALVATLFLTACDKPVVVNVPAETVVVPGPAGPAGKDGESGTQGINGNKGDTGVQGDAGIQGDQGNQGNKGNTGEAGENTTVIITPPAEPAPAN